MKNSQLRKGERVFLSQLGAKGFYYPSDDFETLLTDVSADPLHWCGGGDKHAVLIPETAVHALASSNKKLAVWI
jgi:hypothetical protein